MTEVLAFRLSLIYSEHREWIKSRLGVLIQRSYFRFQGGMNALMLSVMRCLLPFLDQAAGCSSVREIWALTHENGYPLWKCIVSLLKFG